MKKIILISLISTMLFSCSIYSECSPFSSEYAYFVEPNKDSTFKYVAEVDTLIFKIIKADDGNYKTKQYNGTLFNRCYCDCGYTPAMLETDTAKNGMSIYFYIIEIGDDCFHFHYDFKTSKSLDSYYVDYYFEGKIYSDTDSIVDYVLDGKKLQNIGFWANESDDHEIQKIYFSPEYGLIAFVDKDGKEWKRVLE